ncbi:MarC family protein [Kingella kingae]|uniref:MarC family protein n=1 Tax=Kingella kingae TaxID=504 RepID=UPI0003F9EEAD|nr:MarC family protein [Kingella kingae]MDK4530327.1 MarC family protein [Kingella kingae]MDK4536517.1 MarC family protein [Kingella kingae]MDK4538048.1 MarC family protein [Kingella kingae]MDK4547261.1 MarC family protein [Kingella kingae]MDK4623099.1 MarC family protein [Kingella kingae]
MQLQIEIAKIILAFMVLINPFSALPVYLDLTKQYDKAERRKVAQIASFTLFVTIAVFALSGNFILKLFGISTGAFQVGGGILVFLIAISMMSSGDNMAKPTIGDGEYHEISIQKIDHTKLVSTSVVPIAIPMMIGPGGISTVVIYTSSANTLLDKALVIIAGAVISLICLISLLAANKISKLLGETGLTILNRVMGMLLAAVAVEIVVAGFKSLFPMLMK